MSTEVVSGYQFIVWTDLPDCSTLFISKIPFPPLIISNFVTYKIPISVYIYIFWGISSFSLELMLQITMQNIGKRFALLLQTPSYSSYEICEAGHTSFKTNRTPALTKM